MSDRVGRCDCMHRIGGAVPIADTLCLFWHVLVSLIVRLIFLPFGPVVAASMRRLC